MLGAGLLAKKAVEAGPDPQALGEDVPRAGLEGRDRVPRARRPDRAARAARLQPRRLRLHDLHRQLRPAARGDLAGDRGARPRRLLGAVGQPQLRGAHPPRGEDELPRLAAAVRGLRARRPDGPRPARGAAPGRRATCATSGPPSSEINEAIEQAIESDMFRTQLRRGVRGRRDLERARGARGRPLRLGRRVHLRAPAAVLRGHARRGARRASTQIEGARVLALLGDSVTTDHISPAGAIKQRLARRRAT